MTGKGLKNLPRCPHWNENEVLEKIGKLSIRSAKIAQRTHSDLYAAAVRLFGSWRAAVEKAGFNYDSIARRKLRGYWNQDRVIQEIKKLAQKNSNYARQHRGALYSAAIRIFGSWRRAVEAAGYTYNAVRKDWVASDLTGLRLRKRI